MKHAVIKAKSVPNSRKIKAQPPAKIRDKKPVLHNAETSPKVITARKTVKSKLAEKKSSGKTENAVKPKISKTVSAKNSAAKNKKFQQISAAKKVKTPVESKISKPKTSVKSKVSKVKQVVKVTSKKPVSQKAAKLTKSAKNAKNKPFGARKNSAGKIPAVKISPEKNAVSPVVKSSKSQPKSAPAKTAAARNPVSQPAVKPKSGKSVKSAKLKPSRKKTAEIQKDKLTATKPNSKNFLPKKVFSAAPPASKKTSTAQKPPKIKKPEKKSPPKPAKAQTKTVKTAGKFSTNKIKIVKTVKSAPVKNKNTDGKVKVARKTAVKTTKKPTISPGIPKPRKKPVRPISSAVFRGKKTQYDFKVFSIDEKFEPVQAVYIISRRITDRRKRGHHKMVCIGQTASLSESIKKHKKDKCIKQNQANVICLLKEENEQNRLRIEADLREAHSIACNGQ